MKYKIVLLFGIIVTVLVLIVISNLLIIKYNGSVVDIPNTPRSVEHYGVGPALTYVVVGDSTSVAQGGEYDKGIARSTARYIARNHSVTFQNFGVSGARAADVAGAQTIAAVKLHPDIILIDVAANDVTHLTSIASVKADLSKTIDQLRTANANVKIIITGAPQMGSVPRFPEPTRWLAGRRTAQINVMANQLATEKRLVFAPIAAETGPTFAKHPELFAADKFHPTSAGYQIWLPTLYRALDTVL